MNTEKAWANKGASSLTSALRGDAASLFKRSGQLRRQVAILEERVKTAAPGLALAKARQELAETRLALDETKRDLESIGTVADDRLAKP